MNTLDTTAQVVVTLILLAIAALPAIIGAVRDRRAGEGDRDRRTGVLITFDLAYGPHEERVLRANAGRGTT